MTTGLLDDELWKLIEPLLPVRKPRFHHLGRKRLDDRRTLAGILFVLRTGIAWQQLPLLLLADRGYDSKAHQQALRARGIRPVIARRKTAHGSGLGSDRWVVERTLSWLRQHRRLRVRYERTAEIHEAFLSLACSVICLRTLSGPFC